MENNLTLRKFIFCLFILVKTTAFAQQEKPNIIFILTDDQRWDALGFSGNEIIQTPEMDRLAAEGIYFKNAFVTTPICAASRASVLTGLYERTHGYTFGQELNEGYAQNSYPAQLKKLGYETGFFGKFGVNYPGFASLFDVGDSYVTGQFGSYLREMLMIPQKTNISGLRMWMIYILMSSFPSRFWQRKNTLTSSRNM